MWFGIPREVKWMLLSPLLGPFLRMTLVPEQQLRHDTIPIFFDMMSAEFGATVDRDLAHLEDGRLLGPFLRMTLVPEQQLRHDTIPIFFDMMSAEFGATVDRDLAHLEDGRLSLVIAFFLLG